MCRCLALETRSLMRKTTKLAGTKASAKITKIAITRSVRAMFCLKQSRKEIKGKISIINAIIAVSLSILGFHYAKMQ